MCNDYGNHILNGACREADKQLKVPVVAERCLPVGWMARLDLARRESDLLTGLPVRHLEAVS